MIIMFINSILYVFLKFYRNLFFPETGSQNAPSMKITHMDIIFYQVLGEMCSLSIKKIYSPCFTLVEVSHKRISILRLINGLSIYNYDKYTVEKRTKHLIFIIIKHG